MKPRVSTLAVSALLVLLLPGCAARARKAEPVSAPAPPVAQTPAPSTPSPTPQTEASVPALDPVFFAYDSYALGAPAKATLDRIARALREQPDRAVVIEGHCDERGTVEYNLALGERRAQAVRDYLAAAGIDVGRLPTISYGKERPFAQGSGESVWAQNRRAHFSAP